MPDSRRSKKRGGVVRHVRPTGEVLECDASHWDELPFEQDRAARVAVEYARRAGGMTLEEVGDLMGVTRERVRQIEAKALGKSRRRVDPDGAVRELPTERDRNAVHLQGSFTPERRTVIRCRECGLFCLRVTFRQTRCPDCSDYVAGSYERLGIAWPGCNPGTTVSAEADRVDSE